MLQFRIGARPPPLPWGARQRAVFLTACNPQGRLQTRAINRRLACRLFAALARPSVLLLAGAGQALAGDWPAEASLLLIGCPRRHAMALGRRWRQNAVLWLTPARPVTLLALR